MIRRMKERLFREEDGFTLTEVLVAMIMMITVMFALYSIFDMSLRVFSFGNDKTEAVENARLGMERMERELRAAYPYDKLNGTNEIFPNYTTNPSSSITFGIDTQGATASDPPDRKITAPDEEITYELSGGSSPALLRNGQPLAEFVRTDGLTFTYCKSANDCPPSSSITEEEINIVRIELEVVVDRGINGPTTQELTTDVAIRNRTD